MRYAVIRRSAACRDRAALGRLLPPGFEIVRALEDSFIFGADDARWSQMEPVLRASFSFQELTPDEVGEWVPPADHPNDDSSTSAAAPTPEA